MTDGAPIDIPPNNWDTFIKHAWCGLPLADRLEDWPTASRCEETAELLRKYGCKTVLDAASGYGGKTFQFKRLGFEATGIDMVERAVHLARKLAARTCLDVDFRQMAWRDVPSAFDGDFDAVYNDNFQNATDRENLREAAQAAYAALKTGGIALFGAKSKRVWAMTPAERVEAEWNGRNPSIWWTVETPEGQVTTVAYSERFATGIFRHFLHIINGSKLEVSGWFHNLEWGLDECSDALLGVGFSSVKLEELPSGTFEGVAIK